MRRENEMLFDPMIGFGGSCPSVGATDTIPTLDRKRKPNAEPVVVLSEKRERWDQRPLSGSFIHHYRI